MLLMYALEMNLKLRQYDVKAAILHSPIYEEVIIKTPQGSQSTLKYLKLQKSLYGLKQAPKNWYTYLTEWFKSQGFYELACEPDPFLDKSGGAVYFHVQITLYTV